MGILGMVIRDVGGDIEMKRMIIGAIVRSYDYRGRRRSVGECLVVPSHGGRVVRWELLVGLPFLRLETGEFIMIDVVKLQK